MLERLQKCCNGNLSHHMFLVLYKIMTLVKSQKDDCDKDHAFLVFTIQASTQILVEMTRELTAKNFRKPEEETYDGG